MRSPRHAHATHPRPLPDPPRAMTRSELPPWAGASTTSTRSPWPRVAHAYAIDGDRRRTRPVTHRVRHGPDGFAYGYEGSGPAELARCLLID